MAWIFPLKRGRRRKRYYELKAALLDDAKRDGFGVDVDDDAEIEASAFARLLAIIWSINRRVANQNFPRRMIEGLLTWETAMQLRPTPAQGENERRRAVAARMRGYTNNNLTTDMAPAVAELTGTSYVTERTLAEADTTTYWPMVNPGPPGFEFASNRCHYAFELTTAGSGRTAFLDRRDRAAALIDEMRADYNTFEVGTDPDTGFTVGKSLVGQSLLT